MGPGADVVACSVPRAGSGGERKTDVAGERRGNCPSSDLGLGKGDGPRGPSEGLAWMGGYIWASSSGRKRDSSVQVGSLVVTG